MRKVPSCGFWIVALLVGMPAGTSRAAEENRLDLAGCGRRLMWAEPERGEPVVLKSFSNLPAGARAVGMEWDEDRDVREIRLRWAGQGASPLRVEYWWKSWPQNPPHMPTIEDVIDDVWQGKWRDARIEQRQQDGCTVVSFKPLDKEENERADNLPGVQYRRTLKVRVILPETAPAVEALQVFSASVLEPMDIRIEFGVDEQPPASWSGHLEVSNGMCVSAGPWPFQKDDGSFPLASWKDLRVDPQHPRGIVARILASVPAPAGSNDITVVSVRATVRAGDQVMPRSFSFSTLDLERGPIFIPDLHAYVTRAADPKSFAASGFKRGGKIREQIPKEPEQTVERASKEIPPLDPWKRQQADRVYLPVAADASWQKFAIEYGGNVFMSKGGTKAKGTELARLRWQGKDLRFWVGTGESPSYRDDRSSRTAMVEDCLPVVVTRWRQDALEYEEEAFATLLEGPLDPNDPARSEQTPAVLMMRLKVRNSDTTDRLSVVRLGIAPADKIVLDGGRVYEADGRLLRAVVQPPPGAALEVSDGTAPGEKGRGAAARFKVAGGQTAAIELRIPFVSDVSGDAVGKLEALSYEQERDRVARYWRNLIDAAGPFTVPEPAFNSMARSVIPHIHISTTKDPKSGLYMVPAASYGYQVYANEACFQTLLLDVLGDTGRAGRYLDTLSRLQGTRSFPGNYVEPHDGVFHGAKVDDVYDYTASDYGLDHGTVLWAMARHYLYSHDEAWLKATLPHMLKAVEWIERQRALTRRVDANGEQVAEYGLLPAGHLEDNGDWGYWFAVNAYCVAGMVDTAAVLRAIDHADADRLSRQAEAYRSDLRAAVLRATERAPVTRLRDGTYSPYVPTRMFQRFRGFGPLRVQYYSRYGLPDVLPCYRLSATREVLYGPMILLNLKIFGPTEPIADWILDDWEDNLTLSSSGGFNVHGFTDDNLWFSQGGMVFQANLQNPILAYLMRGETPAAIRGTYNAMVSCLYPDVYAFTEEYRMWRHASGPFYKSPDEARFVNRLCDLLVLESGRELWLAAGTPRRWLASKDGIRVDRLNTVFGPVAFTLKAGDEPGTVQAHVVPPVRNRPERIWLYARLPEGRHFRQMTLNGQDWTQFETDQERIAIPLDRGAVDLIIRY